jgi:aryl-alcohol dehydrogenase-like predicted oxidoreductase
MSGLIRYLPPGLATGPAGVSCMATGLTGPAQDRVERKALRHALALGVTLLDTSDAYGHGHAERLIGEALREFPDAPVQVCTKVGLVRGTAPHPYAGRHLSHQLEQSVANLYVEQVAIYVFESFDFGEDDRYLDVAVEQMRALRDIGSIRAIGLRGPHCPPRTRAEARARIVRRFMHLFSVIKPDVVWTHLEALFPSPDLGGEDLLSFTARAGAGLVVAAPPGHPALTPRLVVPQRLSACAAGAELRAQALRAVLLFLRHVDHCAVIWPARTVYAARAHLGVDRDDLPRPEGLSL